MRAGELDAVIDDVLRGDRDAFRKVLRAYGLPLRSYIAAHVHALDDIDDLAQEVFLTAYTHLGDFRRGDDFGAWLRGIARNKIYHHFRSSSRRNKVLDRFREEVARVVEARLERAVSADTSGAIEALLHCIGLLPEKMRRVVRAGLDGDKPADLARELTTSVGAVYRLHARANHLLRDCMRKERELESWTRTSST
jgi:RNA polymerase sigma-70 factor (ECF subfamily)